jgi:hypothetical protein
MNGDQLLAEQLAIASLQRVYHEAQECKRLFENAGMALPPTLLRLFGDDKVSRPSPPVAVIPPPSREHIPAGVKPDWISIYANEASATSITLTIMRKENAPMRPKVLADRVKEILPDVVAGSIYNLGNRLIKDGILESTEEGWKLVKPEFAGVLDNDFLWAPLPALAKADLAAHRREGILHMLRMEPSGLQIVQIVEKLRSSGWMKAPVNKDLLKADMQILEKAELVRLRGNSRKWEVVKDQEAP